MIEMLEEIETEEETQISFNFEAEKISEVSTQTKSGIDKVHIESEVNILLFCVDNKDFKIQQKTYELNIFGKSMKDWLLKCTENLHVKIIETENKQDYFSLIKENLDEKYKYTLVLFSDTPLLKRKTLMDIIEYFILKQLSVLKLTRGYMFETNYLKSIDKLYNPQMQYFDEEDFITAYDLKQFSLVSEILKNRILTFHQRNGVIILDTGSTFIDSDVKIESGVIIYPNNKILGNSVIKNSVVLSYNNYIKNSAVLENASVENSIITDSVIGKNSKIENYSIIVNKSIIKDNVKLSNEKIENKVIEN